MSDNEASWHPDPFGRAELRWWTGSEWTDHVASNGEAYVDPAGAGASTLSAPAASTEAPPAAAVSAPTPAATPPAATPPAATPPAATPPAATPPAATPPAATPPRANLVMQYVAIGLLGLLLGAGIGYVARGDSSDSTTVTGSGDSTGNGDATGNGDTTGNAAGDTTGNAATGSGDTTGNAGTGSAIAAPSLAVPILSGLGSLNSYEFAIEALTVGPTDLDRSEMSASGGSDSSTSASYQNLTSTDTTAQDPEPYTSVTSSWRTNTVVCEFDGQDYTSTEPNPFELGLNGVLAGVMDIVIPTGNASLVGTETIAGVEAEHYTFTIEGLGAGSGAQVDANDGDIWVAVDGRYVLRYEVNASMRSAPAGTEGAEISTVNLTMEMTSVNQPVDIQVPAACPPPGS